jgi:flavin reductase (DIM6/NTAB) family NADH-FMN oxidoreductase RutF
MSFNSRDFRDALGHFATGVCVISANPEGWEPFGLTVNSFASVSLDPPLILWSLQSDSEMREAFNKAERFTVNILRAEQEDLSNQYAKKGDHSLAAGHFELGVSGTPIMPATLVSLECELEARHPGGDHIILVGRVTELSRRDAGAPLLFCAGSYRQLAD